MISRDSKTLNLVRQVITLYLEAYTWSADPATMDAIQRACRGWNESHLFYAISEASQK